MATVSMTPQALGMMIGLPQSSIVHRVIWDAEENLVRIIVEHPLLPEHDGGDGPLPPAVTVVQQTVYAHYVMQVDGVIQADGAGVEPAPTPL